MLPFSGVFSADRACLLLVSLSYRGQWGRDPDRLHKDNWHNSLYPKQKHTNHFAPGSDLVATMFFFLIYKCCNMKHRLIPLQSQRVFGSGSTRQAQICLRDGHFKDCGNCEHSIVFSPCVTPERPPCDGGWEASIAEEFSVKNKTKQKRVVVLPGGHRPIPAKTTC